jgi:hypothetical protein
MTISNITSLVGAEFILATFDGALEVTDMTYSDSNSRIFKVSG